MCLTGLSITFNKTMRKLLFLIIPLIVFGFFLVGSVKAGADDNVSGFAWSENIGWISFNCTNLDTCAVVDYGVNYIIGECILLTFLIVFDILKRL